MISDKEVVDRIEDFLTNHFGDEDRVTGDEAKDMLSHICDLVQLRDSMAPTGNVLPWAWTDGRGIMHYRQKN